MPEIIIFAVGVIAAITAYTWIKRSSLALAKRYGIASLFIENSLTSLIISLPLLFSVFVSSQIRKEPTLALGIILGSSVIYLGVLLAIYFLFTKDRPRLGHFSRSVNILIILSILLLVIGNNTNFNTLIGVLLFGLGILFLYFEFQISQRQNNIIYKFEEKIEKYISIFSFTKQKVLWVELGAGVVLLFLASLYIVDSALSISTIFSLNLFLVSLFAVAPILTFPSIFMVFDFLGKNNFEPAALVTQVIINLTFGIGIIFLLTSLNLNIQTVLLTFITLIIFGILALVSIWEKINLVFVALALILAAVVIFTVLAVTPIAF